MSAPASSPNAGLVGIGTPAVREDSRAKGRLDHVKNVGGHEGQAGHAFHQEGMLTLDILMAEPHLKRAWCSKHGAANSKVIMLGKEWEPPPYKRVHLTRQRKW